MNLFELKTRAAAENGETVLGAKDLGTHACYLIYGVIKKGDPPRRLRPGAGHEEIICIVQGRVVVDGEEGESFEVLAGEAFYLKGEQTCFATALSDEVIYAAAGGHSEGAGHHH